MYNRKNIFIDFLNPDFRRQYGWELNPSNLHSEVQKIVHFINISVLLCKDYCVVPPGFIFLSEASFMAISKCKVYLIEGFLKVPIKEGKVEELVQKKKRQYEKHKNNYSFLYRQNIRELILIMELALIERKSNVGESISRMWLEGPDTKHSIWDEIKIGKPAKEILQIKKIPKILIEDDIACTKPAIISSIPFLNPKLDIDIYKLIHNSHTQVYIDEYDLCILKNIPYFRYDLHPTQKDFLHDYDIFYKIFKHLKIWNLILDLSPEDCVQIKRNNHFRNILKIFETEDLHKLKSYELENTIAKVCIRILDKIKLFKLKSDKTFIQRLTQIFTNKNDTEKIECLCDLLSDFSVCFHEEILASNRNDKKTRRDRHKMKFKEKLNAKEDKSNLHIAFFAALSSEVDILKSRWSLISDDNNLSFSKKMDNGLLSLFTPFDMGRVSAAISTMQYINYCLKVSRLPDLIVVVGIAGGFKEQNAGKGDVLLATDIIDISSRKIKGEGVPIAEFRPKSFEADSRFIKQVNFDLDQVKWGTKVVIDEEWDKEGGKYPVIHSGPIASADEVVGNTEWTKNIVSNHPKMLGVEMEAGGVCAAAKTYNIPVSVVRGVSDHADPLKTDDIWRRRAMKTIANLIEELIFD